EAPAQQAPPQQAQEQRAPEQQESREQEYLPSSVPSAVPSNDAPAPAAQTEAPSEPSTVANAGYVTPLVRKLANERGIVLTTVTGTGVGGRIRKEDLTGGSEQAASAAPTQASSAEVSELRGTTVPMSRLRKIIA